MNLKKRIETALTSPVPSEIRENLQRPHEADLPGNRMLSYIVTFLDDYIDRPKEEDRLMKILNEQHRGILVLTGPPRTGKSTLLAKSNK